MTESFSGALTFLTNASHLMLRRPAYTRAKDAASRSQFLTTLFQVRAMAGVWARARLQAAVCTGAAAVKHTCS